MSCSAGFAASCSAGHHAPTQSKHKASGQAYLREHSQSGLRHFTVPYTTFTGKPKEKDRKCHHQPLTESTDRTNTAVPDDAVQAGDTCSVVQVTTLGLLSLLAHTFGVDHEAGLQSPSALHVDIVAAEVAGEVRDVPDGDLWW